MYRMSGDSNNSMTHPIRRTYGPQQPTQLSLDSSIAFEEQCRRDDLYFNLLYRSFDNRTQGITHRINNLASIDNDNGTSISAEMERNDEAEPTSLLDYRQMDSELDRIQRDYEAIENNLTRFRSAAKYYSPDLNLVGSALTTIAPSWPREDVHRTANDTTSCSESETLAETSSLYQLPTIAELLAARCNHIAETASNPIQQLEQQQPSPPATSSTSPPALCEQCQREAATVEQPVQSKMEANSIRAPEPYKCPVCWNCVRQRKPVSTTCGHVFCGHCIKTALRTTCKCPVCQKFITTRQLFRIYI